VLDFIDVT